MKVEFAEQYGCYCIVLDGNEDPESVIKRAINSDAMYGPDYCVRFPGMAPELYTREALRRRLEKK